MAIEFYRRDGEYRVFLNGQGVVVEAAVFERLVKDSLPRLVNGELEGVVDKCGDTRRMTIAFH